MAKIPPRLPKPPAKDRRFYVITDSDVYLSLQKEAHARDTDVWTLGGSVLTAWLDAGCPLSFDVSQPTPVNTVPSPPPSSSPIAPTKGGAR
jgi:hypothetical protein